MNKTCVVCGAEFKPRRQTQKACGADCRLTHYKRRHQEKYRRNKEAVLARARAYYVRNAERIRAYVRKRYHALPVEKRRYELSPEAEVRKAITTMAWKRLHPERVREINSAYLARRRAAELLALTTTLTEQLNVRPETGNP